MSSENLKNIAVIHAGGRHGYQVAQVFSENDNPIVLFTSGYCQSATTKIPDKIFLKGVCAVCWKIEQYHREAKQTLGIEQRQCRLTRRP